MGRMGVVLSVGVDVQMLERNDLYLARCRRTATHIDSHTSKVTSNNEAEIASRAALGLINFSSRGTTKHHLYATPSPYGPIVDTKPTVTKREDAVQNAKPGPCAISTDVVDGSFFFLSPLMRLYPRQMTQHESSSSAGWKRGGASNQ